MSESELSQAELFDVFSNARRRMAVRYLTGRKGTCDLTPVVEQVAAWENGVQPDDVTRAQRRRVYISLYQTHLPMLADHGIIEWNPEDHRIELRQDSRRFEPYLKTHPDDDTRHRPYVALSVGAVVGLGVSLLSVGPAGAIGAPIAAVVICLCFLAVAGVHYLLRNGYSVVPRFRLTVDR